MHLSHRHPNAGAFSRRLLAVAGDVLLDQPAETLPDALVTAALWDATLPADGVELVVTRLLDGTADGWTRARHAGAPVVVARLLELVDQLPGATVDMLLRGATDRRLLDALVASHPHRAAGLLANSSLDDHRRWLQVLDDSSWSVAAGRTCPEAALAIALCAPAETIARHLDGVCRWMVSHRNMPPVATARVTAIAAAAAITPLTGAQHGSRWLRKLHDQLAASGTPLPDPALPDPYDPYDPADPSLHEALLTAGAALPSSWYRHIDVAKLSTDALRGLRRPAVRQLLATQPELSPKAATRLGGTDASRSWDELTHTALTGTVPDYTIAAADDRLRSWLVHAAAHDTGAAAFGVAALIGGAGRLTPHELLDVLPARLLFTRSHALEDTFATFAADELARRTGPDGWPVLLGLLDSWQGSFADLTATVAPLTVR